MATRTYRFSAARIPQSMLINEVGGCWRHSCSNGDGPWAVTWARASGPGVGEEFVSGNVDLHTDGADPVQAEPVAGFRVVAVLDELPCQGVDFKGGPVQSYEVCPLAGRGARLCPRGRPTVGGRGGRRRWRVAQGGRRRRRAGRRPFAGGTGTMGGAAPGVGAAMVVAVTRAPARRSVAARRRAVPCGRRRPVDG